MSAKRRVEVFTAGCSLRDETVKLVKELACPSCEVNIYGLSKSGMEKAKKLWSEFCSRCCSGRKDRRVLHLGQTKHRESQSSGHWPAAVMAV